MALYARDLFRCEGQDEEEECGLHPIWPESRREGGQERALRGQDSEYSGQSVEFKHLAWVQVKVLEQGCTC